MMTEQDCPVSAPKLLKARSVVETCAGCGAWVQRYPAFMGEDDGFWQCEKCSSTAIRTREGRAYGPNAKAWEWVQNQFNELYLDIPYWDWDTVETEPPMASLDWVAVEAWFRSKNIYRVFIPMPAVTIVESNPGHFDVTVEG